MTDYFITPQIIFSGLWYRTQALPDLHNCRLAQFFHILKKIPFLKFSVNFLAEVKVKWEESASVVLVGGNIGSWTLYLGQSWSGDFLFVWRNPQWARASSFTRFLDHTQRRTTYGRIPQNNWSARHRDLYLTTHNTHNRQTSTPPVGFEPQFQPASGRRPTP